jgi:Domain of unknown function (DUF1876)
MTTRTWTVQVKLDEIGDDTTADAVLGLDNKAEVRGHGRARRNPADQADVLIGDELAAARALSDLAHELLSLAATDIESRTHAPATLSM